MDGIRAAVGDVELVDVHAISEHVEPEDLIASRGHKASGDDDGCITLPSTSAGDCPIAGDGVAVECEIERSAADTGRKASLDGVIARVSDIDGVFEPFARRDKTNIEAAAGVATGFDIDIVGAIAAHEVTAGGIAISGVLTAGVVIFSLNGAGDG